MEIKLNPETEEFIKSLVEVGLYDSPESAVNALLVKEKADRDSLIADIKQKVAKGRESLQTNGSVPMTDELVKEIKSKGRARLTARKKIKDVA